MGRHRELFHRFTATKKTTRVFIIWSRINACQIKVKLQTDGVDVATIADRLRRFLHDFESLDAPRLEDFVDHVDEFVQQLD